MAIDFSYLEGEAPQEECLPIMPDIANVTIRVDADSLLLCDGEYIDQPFKAGALTKIQIGPGQHLLEFLYTEDPDIKIEKEVDFPESGKSYLVLIKGLKDLVDAAAEEVKRKAEEEARVKAEAEAKRIAEEEARKKAEEEAEAEAKRKAEIKKIVDLAEDYYRGRNGKSKDYKKAVANYLIAAETGDPFSLYSLGWCYEKGQGVKQSTQEAEKWYRKAAAQGESKAKERLKIMEEEKRKEKSGAINGHDYVDLGLPSGLKWATCNVGADSPEKYGDYYAWGEVNTKSEYTSNNSKTEDKRISDISGNSTYDVARKKWGSSWRMPTEDEIRELWSKCKWLWTTKEGKNGFKVFGPNGNTLFLPATGICIDSEVSLAGIEGQYWSSTPVENYHGYEDCHAYYWHFYNFSFEIECDSRYYGHSVRPVSK